MKVGIVARTDVDEAITLARHAFELLRQQGVECIVDKEAAVKLGLKGVDVNEVKVDAIVAIGGDGTILRLVKKLRQQAPILGIRLGKVCFLGEVDPESLEEAIKKLVERKYYVEEAMRLRVTTESGMEVDVVNEVAVVTSQPAKVMWIKVLVEGAEVYEGLADGVIVATPTGSTGYAMSALGPIVDPALEAYLIVLLNPLNLNHRPLIASAEKTAKVIVGKPGATLVADGEAVERLSSQSWIKVRRAPSTALFIRLGHQRAGFYDRLRKLFEARARVRGV